MLEEMGRAGTKDRGSRITFVSKDPLHTAVLQSEALFILFFKIVLVTVLYHMNFPFALQYLYLSFKISFLITKINAYDRTEFQ